MNLNQSKLRTAVRFALCFGATGMIAGTALAQDEAATLERIEVTGSRIKRADLETAVPITTIERSTIQASGLQNVGDLLRNLSQADSLGLTNVTSDTNANDGTQTISLRGLGATRTLVLVNGRRWVALGGGAVDTSTIPTSIIDRVEILADGASAIYGSDAIGGVVNIILRKDYDGAEAEVYYGQNGEGDGELLSYNFTVGSTGDRHSALFNISKTEQDPIFAGDREISRTPVFGVPEAFGSAFGQFGFFNVPGRGAVALNPAREGPGLRTAADFIPFSNAVRYNFSPTNYLLTPSDRLSAFGMATTQLTDNIRFFGQLNYNQRKSVTQIAEVPLTVHNGGIRGPQWRFPVTADNVYNPFGVQLNADVGFRMSALGPRTNIQDYDTYMGTVGLEGSFEMGSKYFDWDVFFSRGETTQSSIGLNYVNLFNLQRGLGPSFFDAQGVARCGTASAVISGCVPVNLFNGQTGLTPEMLRYIGYTLVQQSGLGVQNWGANISGEVLDLPAGALGVAAGVEWRRNSFYDQPDALIAGGGSSTNFREPTNGQVVAEEYYLELAVPLLADLPGAERLELNLAGRKSDYESSGSFANRPTLREFDADNYKYGFTWKPFGDLLVRGNYADTFRAPSVTNLFSGGGEGFPGAIDPCTNAAFAGNPFSRLSQAEQARCFQGGAPASGTFQATSQLRALGGGNPLLNPESGRTKTLGFVYSPAYLQGFDISVDWYEIFLKDGLANRSAQSILNGCIRDEGNNPSLCSFIERASNGTVITIRTAPFNLASIELEGYDVNANYRFDMGDWGSMRLSWQNTYTASAKVTTGSLSTADNLVGRMVGAFSGPTWRLRSNFNTTWNYGDFGLNWGMRYLSHLVESCAGFEGLFAAGLATRQICTDPDRRVATGLSPRNRIGSHTYHDLQGSWSAPWNATVRLGVRNAFDKQPAPNVSSFANSFDDAYDIPGRYMYMSYQQNF
jgi:iron complex outermembrane recepter protein